MGDFDFLNSIPPEKIADEDAFKAITGAYKARVEALSRNTGDRKDTGEPYDFYSLNVQVTEVAEGDRGVNRYLSKNYNNDERGITALRNDMFTAGLADLLSFKGNDELDKNLEKVKDKVILIRAWASPKVRKTADGWERDNEAPKVQKFKVVEKINLRGLKTEGKSDKADNVPF